MPNRTICSNDVGNRRDVLLGWFPRAIAVENNCRSNDVGARVHRATAVASPLDVAQVKRHREWDWMRWRGDPQLDFRIATTRHHYGFGRPRETYAL